MVSEPSANPSPVSPCSIFLPRTKRTAPEVRTLRMVCINRFLLPHHVFFGHHPASHSLYSSRAPLCLRLKLDIETRRTNTLTGARLTCGSLTPSPAGKRYVSQPPFQSPTSTDIAPDCLPKSRLPRLRDPVLAAPTHSRLVQTLMTTSLLRTTTRSYRSLQPGLQRMMVPLSAVNSSQSLVFRPSMLREYIPPQPASLLPSKPFCCPASTFTNKSVLRNCTTTRLSSMKSPVPFQSMAPFLSRFAAISARCLLRSVNSL